MPFQGGSNLHRYKTIGATLLLALSASACVPRNSFERLDPTSEYAKAWTTEEARQKVSGHTFLRHISKRNEALFFDPSGVVYQWVSGRTTVASSTWVAEMRSSRPSEAARTLLCTSLPRPEAPELAPRYRCIDPSLLFIPATTSVKGDAFKLAGRKDAPAELPGDRMRIQDVAKLSAPSS